MKKSKQLSARPVIEELEQRILYSADLNPLMIPDGLPQAVEQRLVNDTTATALQATQRANQAEHRTHEIVFIDSHVEDYQRFIDDLHQRDGSRDIDVVLLNDSEDGVAQISNVLDGETDISAIHIISHGNDGTIQLGKSRLDFVSLVANAAQIKGWGNALSDDADILIYGCDVAATQQGQALIDSLGRLTGADVAASDDLTGSSERGGDWALEFRVGHIETLVALSAELRTNWYGTLATYTVTNTNNSGAGSLRAAITSANGNVGVDTIAFNIALTDANHLYYRDNGAAGFSAPVTTTLADAAITDFDANYPAGTARSWYRISLSGADLDVTEGVIIDGSTQPGYNSSKGPVIELNATGISSGDPNALTLTTGASTVRGLIINGAGDNGIEVDAGAGGSTIVGNFIGTDASGTQARPNSTGGTWGAIAIKSDNVVVGGTTAADRNLISGNAGYGIEIYNAASGASIRGNYIGTTATGAAGLANGADGILIRNNAASNTIGGIAAGAGNVIAFNGGDGISITSTASGNSMRGNSIYSNTGLGIDLSDDGVTANDANDPDAGPNALKNFPVVTLVKTSGSTVTVSGTLNTTANAAHTIDFYASANADVTGYGEGATYLGSTAVTTDASGNASFNNISFAQAVPIGYYISAVTVDLASGNTSEFSRGAVAVSSTQATVTVDTISDSSDGDTTSLSTLLGNKGADGFISLREAIIAANNTANGTSADRINFSVAGAGPHTIALTSALPTITNALIIDGSSEPDYAGSPVVVLDGVSAGAVSGLTLGAGSGGSTIRGLVVQRFGDSGIVVQSNGNTIAGNYIGTDVTGLLDRGNTNDGVVVIDAANNVIGGTTAADRNLISGNGLGVRFGGTNASGNLILGNHIGADASGGATLGNDLYGIYISRFAGAATGDPHDNRIGGTTAAESNLIVANGRDGIETWNTNGIIGNSFLGNRIYNNGGLGIDLRVGATNGVVTVNDTGDADAGANNLQNFPALGFARTNAASQVVVSGSLNSAASSYYRIEFFANTSQDGSGYGEGQTYLGFVNVSTNALGNAVFSTTLSGNVAIGAYISATATKSNATFTTFTDTSEFAADVAATASPVNTVPGAQSTNEDTPKVFSSANGNAISIADADAGGANNEVTIRVTNGGLTLSGTAGLSFVTGDGTTDATMTFRGTASAINTALNGLTYIPTPEYSGSATLTLATKDSTLLSLNVDANLQGRYEFSGNANDTSPGTAQNGTLAGNAAIVTDATRGQVLNLDGSGDYVQVAGTFGNPTEVTIGGWVNLTSVPDGRGDFITLSDRVHITLDETGVGVKGSVQTGSGTWTDLSSGHFIAGTGWHHVMYSYSDTGNVHNLYIDGSLVASATIAGSIYWTGAGDTFIGKHPTSPSGLEVNGRIDEARIYDRALTVGEIGALASDLPLTDTDTVAITVTAVNDAPAVANPITDQAATEDVTFSFQFATNTFNDVDAGDSLTYIASSVPTWLSFDAATRTFSGTPANADVGTVTLTVRATDLAGAYVEDQFDITVANTNDAPTIVNPIADQAATEDAGFNFQFAANTFADVDAGDTLTYSTSGAPSWLSFDAATRTFSGTPANADVGMVTLTVRATDLAGAFVEDQFDIVVANTNDAPTVANPIADQSATEDSAFSFQFAVNTFNDIDAGDVLTYSAGGVPAWLTFDAATRTFSGTPTNADVGTSTITVRATDLAGAFIEDQFNIVVANTNDAPAVANPIADQAATEDVPVSFQFAANTFADVDIGETLTYTASGIPAWLSFDAATRTFIGTPANPDVGTVTITVRATDLAGAVVEDQFDIVVANTNDTPTVANPITDQLATEDTAFSFQFAANTFNDIDIGDTLTYSASGVPSWLSFDAATRTFTGTPANADVGTATINVRATDLSGSFVEDQFDVVVGNSNDAPTVVNPIVDQNATEDAAFTFQFATNTFNDVDAGDSLTYSASGVPAWLTFDAATRTFTGTPTNADVGTATITVRATDGLGAFAEDIFDIVVSNVNDAPTVVNPITDQTATEDAVFSFQFAANTFADVDVGNTLTYSASGVPAWVTFDAATRTFSGTPANADVGTRSITLRATDGSGAFAEDIFDIVVGNTNDAPTIANPITDKAATEDTVFSFQFAANTFADVDVGDTLTYTASGVPTWLSFDAATRTFSGTPANADVGTVSITVRAIDLAGAYVEDQFDIVVANTNDAPTVANPIADQNANEDAPFSFQFAANTFADVDAGDSLSYTAAGMPAWLTFDAATRTFSGTPANADVGTLSITVRATDLSGTFVEDQFDIVVANTNDAPTAINPMADQAATEDAAFNFQFATNTFADVDVGDMLTYTASGVPSWLSFDAATRTFSGTPANADVGLATIIVHATDGSGAFVEDQFDIIVANTNDAPAVANPISDQAATEDSAFSFTFAATTFNDVDTGDTLTYTTSGVPSWLSFDAATRTFVGTPANADVGTATITVRATDGSGAFVEDNFDIVVSNVNDAPTLANPIADQAATEDGAFTFQFAANTFADIDAGDTLTYSASAVPSWLTFDAATRTFSGTPTNADVGTTTITVRATDLAGAFIEDQFNIVVANTNDTPTVANPIADQAATEDVGFSFQFATNAFADVDDGDTLIYSTSGAPSWLSFDAATRTFSGTPANADVGTVTLTVRATDFAGAFVEDQFDIVVANANDAPTVANPIADQNTSEDAPFSFQFAANTFSEVDLGDNLSYAASGVPSWLSFDAATRTFSGTPANADVGTITITVRATDLAGAFVEDQFDIVVTNTNDTPTVANPIADQSATEDSTFSFQFAANTFNDVDVGESLTYTTSGVPSWLSFDAATRTFTGTPANADVGSVTVTVRATDLAGAFVEDQFDIAVANTNDTPTVVNPITNQAAAENTAFSFQFAANTFNDIDIGDTLVYSASGAPSWLSFNAATRTFAGTPANADVGTATITVRAVDLSGGFVEDQFDIVVANSNDAPTVANPIVDQNATEDAAFTFQFATNTFNDVDAGDSLTYSASGVPAWLTFDAATRTFTGTPANADVGAVTVTVRATDLGGAYVEDQFDIVVANSNDAPTIANSIADQSATEDAAFNFQFAANTFADVDAGDTLSYTAAGIPVWLSFDAATRTFSGTPANADVGTLTVTVRAMDLAGAFIEDSFDIVVANTNDAPMVANPIADQGATEDTLFSFQFAANTFADADVGDGVTYTTSGLPTWLSFDVATHTFTGTPANADVGTVTITVRATDLAGAFVEDQFDIVVANANDAPTVANPIADQNTNEDAPFSFQFPANTFSEIDLGDNLSYTSSGVPSWLSFDAATRTFSGTPANADVGTITITVRATDLAGAFVEDQFDIVVTNTNDTPTVANPIADQSSTEDNAFNFQFAANTFNDVDAGESLTYTASGVPGWLSFDAATRTFTGTPGNPNVGTVTITVRATDLAGAFVEDQFDIVVANTNDTPTVANPIADQLATEDTAFSFQFAANTFSDIDVGDTLTYSVGGVPSWLSFDAATRTFSGNPANADVGAVTVIVRATDLAGAFVEDTFDIIVADTNDAPTVANPIADQTATEDSAFSFQFVANTFNDVDGGDSLTYTASGVPAWLTFDAATRTFAGTPTNADVASFTITLRATDLAGAFVEDQFDIVVANANDTPTVPNPIADQGATEDALLSFQFAANTFADVDVGDTLTYTASGVPTWLSFDAATRTFSGTPANADVGIVSVTVRATDPAGAYVEDQFDIVVANTNDAPTLANPIADRGATEDAPFSFQFAANTFADVDASDSLSYSAAGMPAWLTFDATTRTFSGTPANADVGMFSVTVRATDLAGTFVEDQFDIVVVNTNDAPVAGDDGFNTTEDTIINIPANGILGNDHDIENDPLSVTVVSGPSHGQLTMNSDGSFSYLPDSNFNGTDSFSYQANDGGLNSNVAIVAINVTAANDAPSASSVSVFGRENVPFVFSSGDFSFSDVDGNSLSFIRIDVLPSIGQLQLNGIDVSTGQSISTAQLNSGALVYFPAINGNGAPYVTLSYSVSDGSLFSTSQTLHVNILAVNASPVFVSNNLTLYAGGSVTLTPSNLSVIDSDSLHRDLVFHIELARSGYFELADSPGNRVMSFSQEQLRAGLVRFVHDGSDNAPAYAVTVSDGFVSVGPELAQISFYARPLLPSILVPTPNPALDPTPTPAPRYETRESDHRDRNVMVNASGDEFDAEISDQTESSRDRETVTSRQDSRRSLTNAGVPSERASVTITAKIGAVRPYIGGHWSSDVAVDSTTPLRLQFGPTTNDVVIPVSGHFDIRTGAALTSEDEIGDGLANLSPEERRNMEIVLNSAKLSGVALSVGAVWWATRAGGLLASLLATAPAWRSIDPLPIFGRTDDEEEDLHSKRPTDDEAERDDRAIGDLLDRGTQPNPALPEVAR